MSKEILNKIKGSLFGAAIGDALGGTTEFMDPKSIKQKYGYLTDIIGGGVWDLEIGETTDDTAMFIAVADGILANPQNPIDEIGKRFIEWENTNPKDIGNTILSCFEFFKETNNWEQSAKLAHDFLGNSAGNGALMRCIPVPLAYKGFESFAVISKQAQMTHHDNLSTEACIIYNKIARKILNGYEIKDAIKKTLLNFEKANIYTDVLTREPNCNPTGFVVDTLKWVLYDLLNSDSFEESIQKLTNRGYDSDTTATIAGGLAGLYYGYDSLPKNLVNKILLKNKINDLSIDLYKLRES